MKKNNNGIILTNNLGFKWFQDGNTHTKGYLFDKNNKLYQEKDLCSFFSGISTKEDFIKRLKSANGLFSVIVKFEDKLFAAVDRCRSFPVFYTDLNRNIIVSDSCESILPKLNQLNINHDSEKAFLSLGFCSGNSTLIEGIKQLQAGEYIYCENDICHADFYHHFIEEQNLTFQEDEEGLSNVLDNTFSRAANFLKGKTAVIPLSGGYDSRIIAVGLKKMGVENIVSYTYGRKGNQESELSYKVAKQLGIKRHRIIYDEDLIKDYINSSEFKKYYPYAANFSSTFFMLEYFAVKYLKENNLIPDNSVFLPGYTGDGNAGSRIPIDIFTKRSDSYLIKRLGMQCYIFLKPHKRTKRIVAEEILAYWKNTASDSQISNFYSWDIKERFCKYNINCVSTFTYFGYKFYLPLWDKEFVDFFSNIDKKHLYMKKLYNRTLQKHFFEKYGLNFSKELLPSEQVIKKQIIKEKIKAQIPPKLLSKLYKYTNDDLINEVSEYMVQDLEKKGINVKKYSKAKNSIIAQWYLRKIKEKLNAAT